MGIISSLFKWILDKAFMVGTGMLRLFGKLPREFVDEQIAHQGKKFVKKRIREGPIEFLRNINPFKRKKKNKPQPVKLADPLFVANLLKEGKEFLQLLDTLTHNKQQAA